MSFIDPTKITKKGSVTLCFYFLEKTGLSRKEAASALGFMGKWSGQNITDWKCGVSLMRDLDKLKIITTLTNDTFYHIIGILTEGVIPKLTIKTDRDATLADKFGIAYARLPQASEVQVVAYCKYCHTGFSKSLKSIQVYCQSECRWKWQNKYGESSWSKDREALKEKYLKRKADPEKAKHDLEIQKKNKEENKEYYSEYAKAYNKRPDVVEKRKARLKQRYAENPEYFLEKSKRQYYKDWEKSKKKCREQSRNRYKKKKEAAEIET